MKLNLKKPVVFFDIESTGLNIISDRIIQIAYIKLMPNGEEICKNYLFNPGMPIPAESTAIHHITDEMVKDMPKFKERAQMIANELKGCDLAGFNSSRFDVPILVEEMLRAGIDYDVTKVRQIDVMNIFHKKERRDLTAAYKFYCGKSLEDAHSADADTRATYEVFLAQLERYEDLPGDVDQLHEFCKMNRNADLMGNIVYNDKNEPCINFGKHKGKPVVQVLRDEPSYYAWIIDGQFAQSTKKLISQIRLSMMMKQ